jgi:predicted nuclease of predicted toxin-antitoxin system
MTRTPRLKLYLDDCAYSKRLRQMLLDAGHQVVTPFEAGLVGFADSRHFDYACQHELVIVTKDADDFEELHRQNHQHFGILAICEEADRSKNMSYGDIVRAIENITAANVPLPGQFYVLNHWRW